jgi:RNA polymerase sigma-70 factor (sigma-E family)
VIWFALAARRAGTLAIATFAGRNAGNQTRRRLLLHDMDDAPAAGASVVTTPLDAEFSDYMSARMPSLRRFALLLCQDWHRADDLVQLAMTKLYLHWAKAVGAQNTDAYVRGILVREFIAERRTGWSRRVSLTEPLPDRPPIPPDHDGLLDLQAAVAKLPARQRAVLVLRFYCDLNVDQSAEALGCAPGTVKSQTAKALASLRRALAPESEAIEPADPVDSSHREVLRQCLRTT